MSVIYLWSQQYCFQNNKTECICTTSDIFVCLLYGCIWGDRVVKFALSYSRADPGFFRPGREGALWTSVRCIEPRWLREVQDIWTPSPLNFPQVTLKVRHREQKLCSLYSFWCYYGLRSRQLGQHIGSDMHHAKHPKQKVSARFCRIREKGKIILIKVTMSHFTSTAFIFHSYSRSCLPWGQNQCDLLQS